MYVLVLRGAWQRPHKLVSLNLRNHHREGYITLYAVIIIMHLLLGRTFRKPVLGTPLVGYKYVCNSRTRLHRYKSLYHDIELPQGRWWTEMMTAVSMDNCFQGVSGYQLLSLVDDHDASNPKLLTSNQGERIHEFILFKETCVYPSQLINYDRLKDFLKIWSSKSYYYFFFKTKNNENNIQFQYEKL